MASLGYSERKKVVNKKYYIKNSEKLKAYQKGYRAKHKKKIENHVCPLCDNKFDTINSNRIYCSPKCTRKHWVETHRERHRKQQKIWREKNKEKFKKYCEEHKEKIKTQQRTASKIWREKNKERLKIYSKEYREKNRDRIRAYHEKNKEKIKAQRDNNKEDRCRNAGHVYRTLMIRKKYAPVKMTREEFISWYNSKPKICCYCGIPEDTLKFIDWIPEKYRIRLQVERVDGDKNYELDNINLACHACNQLHQRVFTPQEVSLIAECFITPKWKKAVLVVPLDNCTSKPHDSLSNSETLLPHSFS